MNRQTVHQHQALNGTERYGAAPNVEPAGRNSIYLVEGVEPAPPSGVPYGGVTYKNGTCTAETNNGDFCMAPKAKGTEFCIGHIKKLNIKIEE